jgi:hypothetical protein
MEKQPHQEYRDELAKKLNTKRDAGKNSKDSKSKITRAEAKGYLDAKKEDGDYQPFKKDHKEVILKEVVAPSKMKERMVKVNEKLREVNLSLEELKKDPIIGHLFEGVEIISSSEIESNFIITPEGELRERPIKLLDVCHKRVECNPEDLKTKLSEIDKDIELIINNQDRIPTNLLKEVGIDGLELYQLWCAPKNLEQVESPYRGAPGKLTLHRKVCIFIESDSTKGENGYKWVSNVFAPGSWGISSARFKEELRPIENVVEKVGKLRGVSFKWKSDGTSPREIGVIAEEVAEVFPELVFLDRAGKPLGVHYDKFVAVLIEAVKELKGEIEELKKK